MLLWFLGTASVTVVLVFRDQRFDHRVLALGVLLPDIVDAGSGGAWALHSVTASVVLLILVMALTVGKRERRRRWLALPIGTFLHLVFDGAFGNTSVFWWPFTGLGFDDAALPVVDRGAWNLLLELIGALLLAWLWRRFDLADPANRRWFLRTGQLVEPTAERRDRPAPMC